MVTTRRLAALLLAGSVSAKASNGPNSLGSDVSILVNNDLLQSQSPNSDSAVLLLSDALGFQDAVEGCAALGETLWTDKTPFAQIKPNLDYLAYQGHSPGQRYWIAPDSRNNPRAVDGKGKIVTIKGKESLPALCTQSAPYSNDTYQDSSSNLHVTVFSNNEYLTGFRDRLAFRFQGIRYAKPAQRWTYSQPYTGSGGAVSALEYGDVCMQYGSGSEDCFFLNVWTPYLPQPQSKSHKKDTLKPVMLWIHGGAFTGGESSDQTFDGSNLASRGDVVVVAINYRLGSLGFLALDDGITNGNYGLGDQVTALEWVQKNIQDFGGDPDRVTIFGQSAGAASVRALLASPKARGKFSAAIMQSNLGGLAYGTTYSKYYTIAEQMAVAGDPILAETNCSNAASQLDCLRQIPASTISTLPDTARYLVVDGEYLISDELNLQDRHATANVPLMIGLMRDDGAAIIGYPSTGETLQTFVSQSGLPSSALSSGLFPQPAGTNLTLDVFNATSRMYTDGAFRCIDQATAYAGFHNNIFPSVHFYEFTRSYQMPGWSPNPPLCEAPRTASHPAGDPSMEYFKCHSGELYYVFGNVVRAGLPLRDQFDLPFAQFALDSWASFARTHNPTPDAGLLSARGYTSTQAALARSGAGQWNAFSRGGIAMRKLEWPPAEVPLVEAAQCKVLNLPLDYYL